MILVSAQTCYRKQMAKIALYVITKQSHFISVLLATSGYTKHMVYNIIQDARKYESMSTRLIYTILAIHHNITHIHEKLYILFAFIHGDIMT